MAEATGANAALQLVVRFNDAFNAHDVSAMMRMMTDDCVFENTHPAPDGTRYEGQQSVRTFWLRFFWAARGQTIEIEELFAAGERCIMRWTYHWLDAQGAAMHVRGVDIYRIRDGLIAEKISYVKG
jgi:ketosteroid isomerase-like protein